MSKINKDFVFAHKVHLDFVKEDNTKIKMGTFITKDGLKDPKIVNMMFKSLKNIFIENVANSCGIKENENKI